MKSNYAFAVLLAIGAISISGTSLRAADTNSLSHQDMKYEQADLYRANELSVDGFGTASIGKYTINHPSKARVRNNTEFGVGMGVNYFITRNIGISADAYSEDTGGAFIDSASANLTLRLPLGDSGFAPYIFGGGGCQFDLDQAAFAQAGAGIEYRFCPRMGVFLDARGVVPNEEKYYGVVRLGMRFAF